ncbi:MAG: phosphatidylinositol-specific phospholipase C/glycerophosphodiester phosphodiesterase family protein [Rhodothermales bacterium]
MLHPTLLLLVFGLCCSPVLGQDALRRAHAHNDYEHDRPLYDALEHGFVSIEADIHLRGDTLYIAHDAEDIRPGRTLEALYLAPLYELVASREGHIYANTPLLLLIDIKTDAEDTYSALKPLLHRYRSMLTEYTERTTRPGAVSVVLSGNRPLSMLMAESTRLAAYDGRLSDLETDPPLSPHLMPLVSQNWSAVARWYGGRHPLPDADRQRLVQYVASAHALGYQLRFWGTGDNEAVWHELYGAGVDLLNADDLGRLKAFLDAQAR